MSTPRPNDRPLLDGLAIVALLGVLVLPTLDLFVRPDELRSPEVRERRRPTPVPTRPTTLAELSAWPRRAESAFNDRFGLRDVFLRYGSIAKVTLFHRSPRWGVLVGRDRWMSYLDDRLIRVARGLEPFNEHELEEWRFALESKRDVLAALGCDYFFGIAPEKDTIYPEQMPARFTRLGPTRLDQIRSHLAARSDVRFVDYVTPLLAEKAVGAPNDPIYYPLGLHWCGRGLVRGFEETLHALRPATPIAPFPRESYVPTVCDNDSAAIQMGIEAVVSQSYLRCIDQPRRVATASIVPGPKQVRTFVTNDASLPRCVMVNDSMVDGFTPLLGDRCHTLTSFLYKRFDFEEIEPLAPEVLGEVFLERALVEVASRDRIPQVPERIAARLYAESSETLWSLTRDQASRPLVFANGTMPVHLPDAPGDYAEAGFRNENSAIEFPSIAPATTPLVAVELDVTVRKAGALVFDVHDGAGGHPHRFHRQVETGRATVHVIVPLRMSDGVLRLRFARAPAAVKIHACEVRAVRPRTTEGEVPR